MPSKTSKPKPAKPYVFEAIGTQWQITVYNGRLDDETKQAVQARIAAFDKRYSRFKATSWINRIGAQPGNHRLPADAQPLLDMYKLMYRLTKGAMTPLVGQTLAQAGYDANYSLKAGPLNTLPTWDEALTYSYPRLTTHLPVQLDVGAAGKGYLVDLVSQILCYRGFSEFVINAGGDLRVVGPTGKWQHVGLENPHNDQEVIGVAMLQNQSLCASAGNRRRWPGFNHIIDPQRLRSPTHISAVWVVAVSALLADALTTALYFASPRTLQASFTFEYLIVHDDNSITQSKHFPAELFTA